MPSYLPFRGYQKRIWYQQQYDAFFGAIARFPSFDNVPPLLGWEAAELFRLEAPGQVLGTLQKPSQYRLSDVVVASSEGSFLEQIPIFANKLNALKQSKSAISIRPATSQDKIISFYLDLAGFPEWTVLGCRALGEPSESYSLLLAPGYLLNQD
ncbi:MAG: hypothetical protein AAFY72_18795 [Cyanobacteria bacterium J06649_4]